MKKQIWDLRDKGTIGTQLRDEDLELGIWNLKLGSYLCLSSKTSTMILDKLENAYLYSTISNNLMKGFNYLQTVDLKALSPGKHEIDGMEVFALVSEFNTKEEEDCKLEAHQLYADIQYIISGREAIGYALLNDQEVLIPYQAERDIVFFKGETFPLILEPGMFVVFFPQDVHQPGMQVNGPAEVKKVVIKVKI